MKRFILSMAMMLTIAMSSLAMSYEQARDRALFLTDKMAYELNLNDEQYEAAYEVNLDYLMSINTYDDLYGTYWTRRNLDLSYILLDWQYNAFCSAAYFYRPLTWSAGVWRFSIYARYPSRTYFYFGKPAFYTTYRGGHSWRMNGGKSWYHGRTFGPRPGESRFGMRDRFDRGDFKGTRNHGGNFDRRGNGNGRGNSGSFNRNDNNRGNFGGYRGTSSGSTASRSNGNTPSRSTEGQSSSQPNNKNNGGFTGSRTNNRWGNINVKTSDAIRQNRSINEMTRQSSTRETVTRTPQVRTERSSNSTPSRSTSGSSFSRPSSSMSNSSFSRPSTSVSRSSSTTTMSRPASTFTPSSSSSNGGSSRASGGGHFGGRR